MWYKSHGIGMLQGERTPTIEIIEKLIEGLTLFDCILASLPQEDRLD